MDVDAAGTALHGERSGERGDGGLRRTVEDGKRVGNVGGGAAAGTQLEVGPADALLPLSYAIIVLR